ncbi:MAG: hypothetical protein N3B13_01630, partial [Deltaproteobacteria bacterium]|nr:hypothetical protein [Deltaproteobacteria bacterium]
VCTITVNNGYTLHDVGGTCGGSLNGNIYTTNPLTKDCTVVVSFTINKDAQTDKKRDENDASGCTCTLIETDR